MSDEAYSLVMALTCLALLGVIYHRWRARRAMRRLIQWLESEKDHSPPPPKD